jgi:signal transduction histidine kinase
METHKPLGLALICSPDGSILKVLMDDFTIAAIKPGNLFLDFIDHSCQEKGQEFLARLGGGKAQIDWELSVLTDREIRLLHFFGVTTHLGLFILGVTSRQGAQLLVDGLKSSNNEQTISGALEEISFLSQSSPGAGADVYEELTAINNEMASLQRELARRNAELKAANDQLEALNDQKNQLLGMAAHDLRAPLGVVLTYSEFLLDEAAHRWSDEHLEFISDMKLSAEFMLRLVNDLLDLSRIEAGTLTLDLQTTDLSSLVSHNVSLNRVLAAKKGIALALRIESIIPAMNIDRSKIEQALNNLITNAIKFSHPATSVEVCLRLIENEVVVSVKDEGQGIPADEMEKLFKPFQKTSVSSTAGEQSTGLGLAITRKVIEGHRGRIWVESQVGRGSTFSFTLPLS